MRMDESSQTAVLVAATSGIHGGFRTTPLIVESKAVEPYPEEETERYLVATATVSESDGGRE